MQPPKSNRTRRKAWDSLDEIDKVMLNHKIEFPAITDFDLGEIVGLTRPQVSLRRGRPAWKHAFDEAVKPPEDYLKGKRRKAVQMYWKLAHSKNETIAERVLSKLLISWKYLQLGDAQRLDEFEPIIIHAPLYNTTITIDKKPKEVVDVSSQNATAGTVQELPILQKDR